MKLAFIIMTEDLKYQQIYTMLNLLHTAQNKGHSILGVFFFGSGVLNTRKGAKLGKGMIEIPSVLSELIKQNIPMYACQTWADAFGIEPETGINGLQITGLGELSTLIKQADKTISFGTHA